MLSTSVGRRGEEEYKELCNPYRVDGWGGWVTQGGASLTLGYEL